MVRNRVYYISFIWMIIALVSYATFRFLICINTLGPKIFLSSIYGLICSSSCLVGANMIKMNSLDRTSPILINVLVLVSIAIVFFLFLLEKLYSNHEGFVFDRFMICFALLVLAISFLYVIFGYLSKIKMKSSPEPLILFVFSCISFSIGFTFSILILEFYKRTGALPNHWLLICVWTAFVSIVCMKFSERSILISTWERKILEFLMNENCN